MKSKVEFADEIKIVEKWFDTDRYAKRPIQEEFEECYKLYNGDHWSLKDPLGMPLRSERQKQSRPNTVENMVFSMIEGLVAEFAEEVDIIDYPVEQGDDDAANVMTELKKYIMYKNRIKYQREQYMRNYFLYGTGIWHVYWDPSWKGGRGPNKWEGEVRIESLHPQIVFPDARCRVNIEDGNRIHKGYWRTTEYILEKFGIEIDGDSIGADDFLGEEDEARVYNGEDEEVLLVETWYKGKPLFKTKGEDDSKYGMHVVWWAGERSAEYLHHENYVYHEPGEDIKFPMIFRPRYNRENSVWGFGEAHYLKSPQIALNKTAELILEGHMHFSLGQTFYRPGAISPKQEKFLRQYGTLPNMYFAVNNLDDIKRVNGKGVDPSLAQESNRLNRTMEGIIGRHDISQGRTPGSVVAFRALDLLAARARIRLRSAENAIITAYEEVGNYCNHLITRFYTEARAYRILGDNAERTEYVLISETTGEEHPFLGQIPPGYTLETRKISAVDYGMFNPDNIKKVYMYDSATGWENTVPYDEQVAQAIDMAEIIKNDEESGVDMTTEYEVYYPELDVMCKVSTPEPSDRAFFMEMSKELLMGGLIDEETFWYVIQNGRFPPWETIMQKKKKEMVSGAKMEAEAAQMEADAKATQMPGMEQMGGMEGMEPGMEQGMDPGMEGGAIPPELEQIFADRPDLYESYMMLPPEQQQQLAQQLMSGSQV